MSSAQFLPTPSPAHRDLARRLRPFRDAGLVDAMPTDWQLLLGQIEMAPYVVLPDAGDSARYDGALCGHPLLRTPIVFSQIGWEHLRIGHGLHSTLRTLILHLGYVFHEGMPIFDLQLVQTHDGGLDALRRFLEALETAPSDDHHRRLVDLVIPHASAYRRAFLEDGGWIDRAARFDYPPVDKTAAFLRPEFTQLTSFFAYCRDTFPPTPREHPWRMARRIVDLASRRLREPKR